MTEDKICIDFVKNVQKEIKNIAISMDGTTGDDAFNYAVKIRSSTDHLIKALRSYAKRYYVLKSELNDVPYDEYFVLSDKTTEYDIRTSIHDHWHIDINDYLSDVTLIELNEKEYYLWKDLLALKRILQECRYELTDMWHDQLIEDVNKCIHRICLQLHISTDDRVYTYFI